MIKVAQRMGRECGEEVGFSGQPRAVGAQRRSQRRTRALLSSILPPERRGSLGSRRNGRLGCRLRLAPARSTVTRALFLDAPAGALSLHHRRATGFPLLETRAAARNSLRRGCS